MAYIVSRWCVLLPVVAVAQRACDSDIFCHGSILDTVQRAALFLDPKRFVDMPTRFSKAQVLENFSRLNSSQLSAQDLTTFLEANFHRAGHELKIVMPSDYKQNVTVFDQLPDPRLKDFAYQIHSKWKSLLRQVDKRLICPECESTTLDLPYPFLVPGGRFREYYYWDTFWILEGVYVSGMCATARAVVENTLWMAKRYGFVPNGARTYYLNRSQPPMLPMIVESYLQHCGQQLKKPEAFLGRALEALELEYGFWMARRSVGVEDAIGRRHVLNRYSADMDTPRPESYLHDIKLAVNMTDSQSRALYNNIAATTESGWDFSGRWMDWGSPLLADVCPGLEHSATSSIVPVDLNAVLHRNELVIGRLYAKLGRTDMAQKYAGLAAARARAIQAVLFRPELNMWKDYNYVTKQPTVNRPFYVTDLCLLWYGPHENLTSEQAETMLSEHEQIMHGYPGGIPISEAHTGQQWDFPNVWAPTQYLAVQLHMRLHAETKNPAHLQKALAIAQKWISTTYCGQQRLGYVFEKYDAQALGRPGGGGEYTVQEGFGWSNGVILWMVRELGANLTVPDRCPSQPASIAAVREEPIQLTDVLAVAVWLVAVLLCATYAVVLLARLFCPPREEASQEGEELLV